MICNTPGTFFEHSELSKITTLVKKYTMELLTDTKKCWQNILMSRNQGNKEVKTTKVFNSKYICKGGKKIKQHMNEK